MKKEKGSPPAEGEQRVPSWVYLLLLLFLVAVLLGVETLLNWLLPAGNR